MELSRRWKKIRSRIFLDRAGPAPAVFLAGMGRSGTTWAADLINYDRSCRVMFEPFNPRRVKEAQAFRYIQYMRPDARDAEKSASATRILGGRLRNRWVDLDNGRLLPDRRMIKDVRCNLMLKWLARLQPAMAVVLVIRHPLSVARSWLRLGWGEPGPESDFQVISQQPQLLADFPVIPAALDFIDAEDSLQRIVFQWCAFQLVPLTQFQGRGLTLLFYEHLLMDPRQALTDLFERLGQEPDWAQLAGARSTPSRTNFLNTDARALAAQLADWQGTFNHAQVRRTEKILSMFGLDGLYSGGRPPEGADWRLHG